MTVSQLLDELGVPHQLVEHRPIFTLEEGLDSGVVAQLRLEPANLVKCLLLQDTHAAMVLVVAAGTSHVNLKAVTRELGTTRLSFASPDRMQKILGSKPGSASLFDLVDNPHAGQIRVAVDERIPSLPGNIGFHVSSNTHTMLVPAAALPHIIDAIAPGAYVFFHNTTLIR